MGWMDSRCGALAADVHVPIEDLSTSLELTVS